MKTILISGGTDGMGRALPMHYPEHGDAVIIAGRFPEKGKRFLADAADMGTAERATFIQADLSLMSENH